MPPYSSRLPWTYAENAFTRAVREKLSTGIRLFDLTISNPTRVLEDYPHELIRECFRQIDDFTYDPDPLGSISAREYIASYYAARGIGLAAKNLALAASTSEAYSILFKLLCDPGDEVLAPVPSYPLFEYLSALESVRIVPYRLRFDGSWHVDLRDLEDKLSPRTKAIVVVNPNNPTGSYLSCEEASALTRLGLPIISDEVFVEYPIAVTGREYRTFADQHECLTFSLNGLSKMAAMPQMKLAWIALGGPQGERAEARSRLELLLDTYLSIATPVQKALPGLWKIGESLQNTIGTRVTQNRATLARLLDGTPAHCLYTGGGWSSVVRLPNVISEEEWLKRLLDDYETVLQPGYFFDFEAEAHLVLSLITPEATFAEGVSRLRDCVAKVTKA